MEKDILEGKEHDVDLMIKEGKIGLVGKYEGKGGGANMELYVNADYFFDKLKEKIPGQVDDVVIEVLKQAVKML